MIKILIADDEMMDRELLETLLETLGDGEDEGDEIDDCSYIVTCSECECVIEVEAWLLEDETAELSCPKCGAILEM